jgi:hypothetical protein
MALENTIKEQLSKTCCKGVDLRREQMNNVTDLSERRKQRLVDEKSRELDYFLERIRYDINISTLEPTIMVGALASFLGRLVGTADPKLESDLLQKTKETVEIFAIREAAKINGTAS